MCSVLVNQFGNEISISANLVVLGYELAKPV